MSMNNFWDLLVALTFSGSILLLIVWITEKCLRRYLSKGALYGLYLLVIASFLLPIPLDDVHFSPKPLPAPVRESFIVTEAPKSEDAMTENNFTPEQKAVDDLPAAALKIKEKGEKNTKILFWLVGFSFSIIRCGYGYSRLKAGIKKDWRPYAKAEDFGFRNIFQSKYVTSPLVMGLWQPVIVLPEEIDKDSICNALAHELVHIKRRDLWWKWLLQLAVAVHWFNPLVYFCRKKWQKYCELSCDERVIALMNAKEKQSYGETLLRLATKGTRADLHLALGSNKQTIKERLVAIMDYQRPTKRRRLLAILAGSLAVILGLLIGACAQQTDYTEQTLEAANHWAEAFCGRSGQECYDLLSEAGKAVFYEQDWVQSTPEDDFYGIGWSSPWMWGGRFKVVEVDGLEATVVYWAQTSNPLVFVWVQQLTFVEEDGALYLENYPIIYGSSIENGEGFAEIYQYALPEYSQEAIEALQDHADQWGDTNYLTPEQAAENYFFLTGGESILTMSENGKATVLYQWDDGSSVMIDMCQPVKQGEGGIWYFSGYHDLQVK